MINSENERNIKDATDDSTVGGGSVMSGTITEYTEVTEQKTQVFLSTIAPGIVLPPASMQSCVLCG